MNSVKDAIGIAMNSSKKGGKIKVNLSPTRIYLIGALNNWKIIDIAKKLRNEGFEVFDSWITPGPKADEYLRKYSKRRGLTHKQIMQDWSTEHIFEFDKFHIDRSDIVIMIMPCGKSGHLELGYAIGQGKKGYILFDKEPKRLDIMHRFADNIFYDLNELIKEIKGK